jgi:hypothetical protein
MKYRWLWHSPFDVLAAQRWPSQGIMSLAKLKFAFHFVKEI